MYQNIFIYTQFIQLVCVYAYITKLSINLRLVPYTSFEVRDVDI